MDDDTTGPFREGDTAADPDGVRAGGSAANASGMKEATSRPWWRPSMPLAVLLALIAIVLGQARHCGTRVEQRDLEIARLRHQVIEQGTRIAIFEGGWKRSQRENVEHMQEIGNLTGEWASDSPVVASIPGPDTAIVGPAQPHRPVTIGDHDPRIRFTRVPRVGDGSDPPEHIAGEVTGMSAPHGYKVVLYAYVNYWYVQPYEVQPMTDVNQGRWANTTHLGTRYAALLVEPSYVPQAVVPVLPPVGGKVLAVAVTPAGEASE